VVTARFEHNTFELLSGQTIRFGRGSVSVPVDIVLSSDKHLHSCAGSITATTDGWVLANLGSHLVLRLLEVPAGAALDVHPGRSLLCPWPNAAIELTWRADDGPVRLTIEVTSNSAAAVTVPEAVDGGTVLSDGIDRTRTYYRVLVELCRRRLEDPTDTSVPEAKEIARKLGMTARAVEKHIEYLRTKYGFGPDRLYGSSNAGIETRGTQAQVVDIAIRTGDVRRVDLDGATP
jgi:hypothetical protein